MITNGLSVVIPCYNEGQALGQVVTDVAAALQPLDIDFEILVVDDGSTDTPETILKACNAPSRLLRNPQQSGYGFSLKRGIRKARYEWIAIIDADGTYPADRLPELWQHHQDFDMIIGARIGEHVSIPTLRKPAKWFIGELANYLAGHKIPDLNSGMRIFRRSLALTFENILPNGFSFTTTITLASMTSHYPVHYIAIDYYKRQGQSKIRPLYHTFDFSLLVVRLIAYFKPLKVFFPTAAIIITLGLGRLLYDVVVLNNVGDMSILFFLTGIQVGFFGLLADMIVKSRQSNGSS